MRTNNLTINVMTESYEMNAIAASKDSAGFNLVKVLADLSSWEGDRLSCGFTRTSKQLVGEFKMKLGKELQDKDIILQWAADASKYQMEWSLWPQMPDSIRAKIIKIGEIPKLA